jgi:OFA family oxalate/formate antiporter-like MFS transporter
MRINNRWVIAIAGVFLQIALGAVYAWSVFRVPLAKQFGWSISEITLTFTISIFVLGFAAFFGGLWLNRKGPRIVALTGGALYGLGVFLASFSRDLWWLYFSYGVIGGIGLGLAYIVPVAVLVKWFPGSQGTDYRHCGGRVRSGRTHHRACGYAIDSERWRLEHIRLSRDRISNRDPY